MAASDHLGPQFQRLSYLGSLPSQYADDYHEKDLSVEEAYQDPAIRFGQDEQNYARHKGFSSAEEHQESLMSDVRAHGFREPVVYHSTAGLSDGHHRYFAARDLGLKHAPAITVDQDLAEAGKAYQKNRGRG